MSPTTGVTTTLASANDLLASHSALIARSRDSQKARRRELRSLPSPPHTVLQLPPIPSPQPSPLSSRSSSPVIQLQPRAIRSDLPPAKKARVARYENYVPEEETIRNDYSQRYVDGGEWPQNWVLGADPAHRFEEYPKQQRLLALKKAAVASHALPPIYLPFSQLSTLQPAKFDVILIDPPFSSNFTWEDLQDLPVPSLAADPSFVLLWIGSGAGEGLERGRQVLAKWGFRRCEDIVWVKTNEDTNLGPGTDPPTTSLLTRTKQHCLMGIRGTVRRSTDSWFVHCNVDTDVIISAACPTDPTLKPDETYTLIENFCLGLRRLELFGRARTLRRGWVSALAEGEESRVGEANVNDFLDSDGDSEIPMKWDRTFWEAKIKEIGSYSGGKLVVPMSGEIELLRPKSPVRNSTATSQLTNILPHNPAANNPATAPVNRGTSGIASGRVMMGPVMPVQPVQSVPMGATNFDVGIGVGINPILNWSDMGGLQAAPMGMAMQQPTGGMGFPNQAGFGGGYEHSWDTQGSGTWDESGMFIGTNMNMGGGGMAMPDMSMGGMGMGVQGIPHMDGTGIPGNLNPMGHLGGPMGMQNPLGIANLRGPSAMGGMGGMGGMGPVGMNNLGMTGMGHMGGMNMGGNMGMGGVGMNMGRWGGS